MYFFKLTIFCCCKVENTSDSESFWKLDLNTITKTKGKQTILQVPDNTKYTPSAIRFFLVITRSFSYLKYCLCSDKVQHKTLCVNLFKNNLYNKKCYKMYDKLQNTEEQDTNSNFDFGTGD